MEQVQAVEGRARPKAALDFIAPHCDIVERLQAVPPSAQVRGLYFRSFEPILRPVGKDAAFREFFPSDRWSPIGLYPLRDYMIRLAVAGALLESPAKLHDGMHHVWRTHATSFAGSLLGRTMLRLLSRDPVRLCEQGLAARRQTFKYGRWEIARHGPRRVEMKYQEEYIWIESTIAGDATGTFESCGVQVRLETRLKDRFHGSTVIQW